MSWIKFLAVLVVIALLAIIAVAVFTGGAIEWLLRMGEAV